MKRSEQERQNNILVQIYLIDKKIQKLQEAKARLEKDLTRAPKEEKPRESKEEILEKAKRYYGISDSSNQVREMDLS